MQCKLSVASDWQCESLQHSWHFLKGNMPQQCWDAQWSFRLHGVPIGLALMHLPFQNLLQMMNLYLNRIVRSIKSFWTKLGKNKYAYVQLWPDWQSESLQHSLHLLKGHIPQQFPESQLLSILHLPPFGVPETWLSKAMNRMQSTRNLGCNNMIPCKSNTSILELNSFWTYGFEIEIILYLTYF